MRIHYDSPTPMTAAEVDAPSPSSIEPTCAQEWKEWARLRARKPRLGRNAVVDVGRVPARRPRSVPVVGLVTASALVLDRGRSRMRRGGSLRIQFQNKKHTSG